MTSLTTMISTMRWTASAADALWCSCAPQSRIQPHIVRYLWHQNVPPCTNPAKQEAMPSKAWLPVFEPGCRAAAPLPGVQRRSLWPTALCTRKGESVIVGSYTFAESARSSVPPHSDATKRPLRKEVISHGKKRRHRPYHRSQSIPNRKQHCRCRSTQ